MKQFQDGQVRIDVKQIPDSVRRQIGAALLKAYRDAKRKEGEKEKAPA